MQCLGCRESGCWTCAGAFEDELFGIVGVLPVRPERHAGFGDHVFVLFDGGAFERLLALHAQHVRAHANGPNIALGPVPALRDDLGRHDVDGAGLFGEEFEDARFGRHEFGGASEVYQLDGRLGRIVGEHDVGEFDVAMDDVVVMQVRHRRHDLSHDADDALLLDRCGLLFDEVLQRPAHAQFQHERRLLIGLGDFVQSDDVGMIALTQDVGLLLEIQWQRRLAVVQFDGDAGRRAPGLRVFVDLGTASADLRGRAGRHDVLVDVVDLVGLAFLILD